MLMLRLYPLLWRIVALVVPIYLWLRTRRGKEFPHRLGERKGMASRPRPKQARLYWLHAASVGESIAAYVLAQAIVARTTGAIILMTSATTTAATMLAQRIEGDGLPIIQQLQPLDHPTWVNRFLNHWQPDALITLESDIWPMMVLKSHAHGIPIAMVSAQMSSRSFKRWRRVGRGARARLFGCFSRIDAIDETHKSRFAQLIADTTARPLLDISGPLKAAAPPLASEAALVKQITKAAQGRFILLLASCHAGEDMLVADAVIALKRDPNLLLIMVPRYIGMAGQIQSRLASRGYHATPLYSRGEMPAPDQPFWIADAMGMMGTLISAADAVIMGGGFAPLGGHNPMEPAALKRGVISGRHIDKNRALYGRLDEYGGVIWADEKQTLTSAISDVMAAPNRLASLNRAAFRAWQSMTHQADSAAGRVIALLDEKAK